MNNNSATEVNPKNNKLIYLIGLVLLQLLISIMPGILLYKQADGSNWQGASILIVYLLVSNLSEFVVRNQYRQQKSFPMAAYAIKLLICSVIIIFFSSKTQWQFALLLFAYELFQTLANSGNFFYLDSPYYTLLNPFFKGFVLNLLFLMKAPLFFQKTQIVSLVPAFIALLVLTLFQQGQVSRKNRKKIFMLGFLAATIIFMLSLFYFSGELFAFWRVLIAVILTGAATFITFQQKNFFKAETLLNLVYLIIMIILYL